MWVLRKMGSDSVEHPVGTQLQIVAERIQLNRSASDKAAMEAYEINTFKKKNS